MISTFFRIVHEESYSTSLWRQRGLRKFLLSFGFIYFYKFLERCDSRNLNFWTIVLKILQWFKFIRNFPQFSRRMIFHPEIDEDEPGYRTNEGQKPTVQVASFHSFNQRFCSHRSELITGSQWVCRVLARRDRMRSMQIQVIKSIVSSQS